MTAIDPTQGMLHRHIRYSQVGDPLNWSPEARAGITITGIESHAQTTAELLAEMQQIWAESLNWKDRPRMVINARGRFRWSRVTLYWRGKRFNLHGYRRC